MRATMPLNSAAPSGVDGTTASPSIAVVLLRGRYVSVNLNDHAAVRRLIEMGAPLPMPGTPTSTEG